ncbi:MAG TPA: biopolymer transporter ExbD [Tepidisphaeraceae bacterium]|jgi:biopolymer transport protein ExbD
MRRKIPDSHGEHPNVVPMIDVIMCLIIFYMLLARIGVDTGEDESIKIPFAALGKEMKSMDNTLLINVNETRDPSGNPTGQAVVMAMVDAEDGRSRQNLVLEGEGTGRKLVDVLRGLRVGPDGREGTTDDQPEMKLIIRGDQRMTFGVLQRVLLASAQAKIKSINFQTAATQIVQ